MKLLPNLLIVDDTKENLFILEVIISKMKVNLIQALSGHEALEKIKGIEIALAIIDVRMPGMNGYELALKINEERYDNKIPVIFLTANNINEIDVFKGYGSGAVDYIFKPFDYHILKSKINIFLYLFNQKQTIIRNAEQLKKSADKLAKANTRLKKNEDELKLLLNTLEIRINQRTEELSRSEELYHTTLNSSNSWVFVIDDKRKLVFVNTLLKNFLYQNGITYYLIGKNIKEVFTFLSEKNFSKYDKVFNECIETDNDDEYDVFGIKYFTETKLSPVIVNNKVVRVVTTVHDNSKLKLIEEKITKNLEREKELNAMKSQFISTVSHEFRTPLAGIQSSVQLLKIYNDKWDKEKKEKIFKQIFDAIQRTKGLLDDFTLVNIVESKKFTLKPSMIYLQELLLNIVAECKHVYGFDFDIITTFMLKKSKYFFDKEILRHIIENILSNAMKYSGNSKKIIFNVIEEKGKILFNVIDYGIGIPATDKKNLFEPFHRASNVENIQGTGLGLSIVKRFVEMHSGNIEIKSETAKGTIVSIILPIIKISKK
ncbi:MAG: response regulator [Bacteroidetes bacterium]|nr:response regulator [Bacteroidota bacterium]